MMRRAGWSRAFRWSCALVALSALSQASRVAAAPASPPDAQPVPAPEAAPAPPPPEATPLPPPGAPPAEGVESGTYPASEAPPQAAELPPGYYGSYPTPEAAEAEMPPRRAGAREHEGLFLRVSVGVGAAIVGYDEAVDAVHRSEVTTRGLAGLFGVSVGGRIVGNLILHGDLMLATFGDANRQVDGTTDARDQINGSLGLLGGGATYYFMPANAYVTAIVGAASYGEQRDNEDAVQSSLGFGMAGLLGKEWWVGRRGEWALGGALRTSFYTASLDIARLESQLVAFDIGMIFTTTFN